MPELPEVRCVAKVLKKNILNKKIIGINIIYKNMIESDSLDFNLLLNKKIEDIFTYGKYLIFKVEDIFLVSHLRMEGKYFLKKNDDEILKHEHIIFDLEDNVSLRYHDTRKFGKMVLTRDYKNYKSIKKLGLEPFDKNISVSYVMDKIKGKNITIKELLLDQSIIAGLGNIYANEVLYASKIYPCRCGKDISDIDVKNILDSSKEILNLAIKEGGTTIKSYTSSLGVIGNYQNFLKVHKRDGEKCFLCNDIILKIRVGGRSTYYCPSCQKK